MVTNLFCHEISKSRWPIGFFGGFLPKKIAFIGEQNDKNIDK